MDITSIQPDTREDLTKTDRLERLKEATEEFEALFINAMLKAMRNTVMESNLFPAQAGKGMYTSMMDEYLAKEIASSGGIGISQMLYEELSKYLVEEVDRDTQKIE